MCRYCSSSRPTRDNHECSLDEVHVRYLPMYWYSWYICIVCEGLPRAHRILVKDDGQPPARKALADHRKSKCVENKVRW